MVVIYLGFLRRASKFINVIQPGSELTSASLKRDDRLWAENETNSMGLRTVHGFKAVKWPSVWRLSVQATVLSLFIQNGARLQLVPTG